MKLRTFKSKKDKLFYFQFRSKNLGKVFLTNPIGFESKIDRNDFLLSVVQSLSDKKLSIVKTSKNDRSYLVLKNKFGKTLIRSKRFKKQELNSALKEIHEEIHELKKIASRKPNSNFTKLKLNNNYNSVNSTKQEILKKDKKPKAEKKYLKKGHYHFNDIYYDIFLSGNGRHYFSFVNSAGKTVLLNGNIKGFDNVAEAEKVIEEVLKFAPEHKNYEIKTAKDGKFFFNLYNDKREKIAKSFFFRKKEVLEESINEFIINNSGTISKQDIKADSPKRKTPLAPIVAPIKNTNKIEINEREELRRKTEAEERRKAAEKEKQDLEKKRNEEIRRKTEAEERRMVAERERQVLERKRKEEAAKKEKQRKEAAIPMAAKSEKANKEKVAAAATQSNPRDPYSDKDPFDGCFKLIGLLFIIGLLCLLFGYLFKSCGKGSSLFSDKTEIHDASEKNQDIATIDSLSTSNDQSNLNNAETNNNVAGLGIEDKTDDKEGNDDINSTSSNNAAGNNSSNNNNGLGNNSLTDYNESGKSSFNDNNNVTGNCNCGDKAVVFQIPNTKAKSVNRLGTNPQFGNTHGLSSADFLEELKHAANTNSWDKQYLNYLYKAMGYSNGFADARVSQISQAKITPGVSGILGFGKYSGYGYSKLDLKGQDLDVFRIEAANGCHINFMKTCGNLLFICE